jgi:hypothetical protein
MDFKKGSCLKTTAMRKGRAEAFRGFSLVPPIKAIK